MLILRLLPLLLPFTLLFLGGFVVTLAQGLGYWLPVAVPELMHGAAFAMILSDPAFWRSLGFSLYVALASASVSVALGAVLACGIWRLPRALQGPAVIYKIALVLPHLSIAFIVLVLLSQSGWVASVAHGLGLIETPADFPPLLFAGNGLGLMTAYVFKGLGFVILMCLALLKRLDERLIITARMLGASRASVFFKVVVPHLYPVLHTSFIILFLYAFGAFDIPYLLAESDPGMLAITVYNLFFQRGLDHRPEAMAILVVMFCFSIVFIALYARGVRRAKGVRKL